MREIGVREFKEQASAILRRLREDKEAITITYRGRPVALLMSIEYTEKDEALWGATWAEMDELAKEVDRYWPEGISAAEAVSEQRREL
jgi:prevent-host-death family protein